MKAPSCAIASAALADPCDAFRLEFNSIGTASPGDAAAIAVGLGVSVTTVMEALYRAPSVLVDGLSEAAGGQMCSLLRELGCSVALTPQHSPPLEDPALFDVALHVTDTTRYEEITRELAAFLGTQPDEAARLISTPPGVILGRVSQATVTALVDRLGSGVALTASDPETALYDVFLAPCDAAVRTRLLADLRRRQLTPLTDDGWLLTGLAKRDADEVWTAHQRIEHLRVVNRDFLRFDLVLTGGTSSPAALDALTEVAGIPPHIAPRLFDAGEITVMEAIPNGHMVDALEQLTAAGLAVRADLISFAQLGLQITEAQRPRALRDALKTLGIAASDTDLRRLPYRLPYSLPELQARILRDALAWSGVRAELIDVPAQGAAA